MRSKMRLFSFRLPRELLSNHNRILVGVLVLQVVLTSIVFWPRSAASDEVEPIFPGLAPEAVVSLEIADGDGNSVTLRKSVGEWVLADADDYPAESSKIQPLLQSIAGLTTARSVTRTDASHQQLRVAVDDFMRRITFDTEDGTSFVLYLGSSPSYGATHFRVGGQSATYLTSDISSWSTNATAAAWIDALYLSLPETEVMALTLENDSGLVNCVKDDSGAWTMAPLGDGEVPDEEKIAALVRRAAAIYLMAPLGKEEEPTYGMDAPSAIATLRTRDKVITLRVGSQDPSDNSFVVRSTESTYFVRVSEYTVKDLVDSTYQDLLQSESTPTAQS